VIFAYGNEIDDLRGWHRFQDQSGWELGAPLILLSLQIGALFGGTYFVGYKILISFALALLTSETFKFLRGPLQLRGPWPALGSALVISSTVWTASSGSAMVWHVIAPPLALMAVRMIYGSRKGYLTIVGFLVLVASFTLNSIVAFAPAIAVFHELRIGHSGSNGESKRKIPWRLLLIATLGLTYLLLQATLNPKFGRYEEYNQLAGLFTSQRLSLIFEASFWFLVFASFTIGTIWVVIFITSNTTYSKIGIGKDLLHTPLLGPSISLLVLSAAPYIAVGKAPIFFQIWDWNGRHGFLFSIALAVLVAVVLSRVTVAGGEISKKLAVFVVVLAAIFSSGFQSLGFQYKAERNEFDELLIKQLTLVLPNVPEGFVRIETFGGPLLGHPVGYQYDLQYLMFQATGEAKWLTTDRRDAHIGDSEPQFTDEVDQLTDIYAGGELKCTTGLTLIGSGWGMPFGPLVRSVMERPAPELIVQVSTPRCQ
jgi:hypothetical protein